MKQLTAPLIAASLLLLTVPRAWAQSVKVIANPSVKVDSISASELKNVFLEEKSSLAGSHVEPVLARGGAAHEAFLQRYLHRSDADLQTYYRSLVFTGRGAEPKSLTSDAEVVAYVARTRGAIGYVSPDINAEGVHTLAIMEGGVSSERKLMSRIEPNYPEVLRSRLIGGTVRLRVIIAPDGNVQDVQVLGGDAALGEAAAVAVAQWKYTPAPSGTTMEVAITFDPHR